MYFGLLRGILDIKRQWRDYDLLQKVQQEKLARILDSASKTPFYRKAVDWPVDSIEDFPIIEKEDIRNDYDCVLDVKDD